MSKSLGVLYVATEADPFAKTGSLAELAGKLPKTVKSLGHDIRVMLPGYGFINNRRFQIHNLLRMKDIEIPMEGGTERAYIKSSYLNGENHKVQVYFIANDRYFNREGLYYHPETKKYFTDNDERFIFFCRGVLETLKRLGWQPKIIHCNDWHTGALVSLINADQSVLTVLYLMSPIAISRSTSSPPFIKGGRIILYGSQIVRKKVGCRVIPRDI